MVANGASFATMPRRVHRDMAAGVNTPRRRSVRRRLGAALAVVGALSWIAAPAAFYTLLVTQQAGTSFSPRVAVWAPVEENESKTVREVALQLSWVPGEEVFAPAWSGLVESVTVAPGQVLSSGQSIGIVGGIQRIAIHSERPFTRALRTGDVGHDVAALNAVLSAQNFPSGQGERYTADTRRGVSALAKTLGVPNIDWDAQFEPDWFLYLPAPEMTIAEISLRPGAPAPAPGESILSAEERIASVRVIDSGDQGSDGPEEEQTEGTGVVARESETLLVARQPLTLSAERDKVDASSFPALVALVEPGTTSLVGVLEQPPTAGQWVVPTAAVITASDSITCVVVGPRSKPTTLPVSVSGQSNGATIVTGSLDIDDIVLVAPPAQEFMCD